PAMSTNIDSTKTTAGPVPPPDAEIIVKPSPSVLKAEDDHHQRRLFLGPMPETVALGDLSRDDNSHGPGMMMKGFNFLGMKKQVTSQSMRNRRSLSSEEGISRERAFRFFMSTGGRKEDFDRQEGSIRREIGQRLKQSGWLLSEDNRKTATAPTTKKWIGDSFEVGKDILGLSTLASQHEEPPVVGRTSIADDKAVSVASPEGDARAFSEVLGDTTLSPGLKAIAAETNMPGPIALTGDTGGRNLSATAIKSIDSSGSQAVSATGSKVGSYVSTTHLLAPPRTTTPEPLSNESTTSLSKRRQDIRKSGSAA
ncbi:hypothetical protein FRC16_003738, partial [Serendipita sp. 398]